MIWSEMNKDILALREKLYRKLDSIVENQTVMRQNWQSYVRKIQSNFVYTDVAECAKLRVSSALTTYVPEAKKENTLVSGNPGDEKNLHPGGRKFIYFLISLIDSFT